MTRLLVILVSLALARAATANDWSSYGAYILVKPAQEEGVGVNSRASDQLAVYFTNWWAQLQPNGHWVGTRGKWYTPGVATITIRDVEEEMPNRSMKLDILVLEIADRFTNANIDCQIYRATKDSMLGHPFDPDWEYTFVLWDMDAHPIGWQLIADALLEEYPPAENFERAQDIVDRFPERIQVAVQGYRNRARPPVSVNWPAPVADAQPVTGGPAIQVISPGP